MPITHPESYSEPEALETGHHAEPPSPSPLAPQTSTSPAITKHQERLGVAKKDKRKGISTNYSPKSLRTPQGSHQGKMKTDFPS